MTTLRCLKLLFLRKIIQVPFAKSRETLNIIVVQKATMEGRRSSILIEARKSSPGTGNVFQKIRHSENIYYNMYAATNQRWTGMLTLIFRWKQSVFSLIWSDVLLFLLLYYFMLILYRCVLINHPEQRQVFEMICIYADRFNSSISITFLIGFWVSQIVSRWWDQFMTLPYPDSLALKLVAYIPDRVSICLLYTSDAADE